MLLTVPVSPTSQFKKSINSFYVTDSPTGQFKQSIDSFYVTDRPLSVTNLAQMAMFYLN